MTIREKVLAKNHWRIAEPGKGYDAKADEWRAKLPPRASDSGTDD